MFFSQMWHNLLPYVFTSYLFTHLIINLPTYYPPTHLLFTYSLYTIYLSKFSH